MRPEHYCPRCKRKRTFNTFLNGAWLELRCSTCNWLKNRVAFGPDAPTGPQGNREGRRK